MGRVNDNNSVANLANVLLPPLAATCFLWTSSRHPVGWIGFLSAVFLAVAPWRSFLAWRRRPDLALPLFALISFVYWLYFGFALFWGEYSILMWQILEIDLTQRAIDLSMQLAVLGVACLGLGMSARLTGPPRRTLDLQPGKLGRNYVRVIVGLGTLAAFFEGWANQAGSLRQLVITIQGLVPLVAFAYLLGLQFRGLAHKTDRVLILAFLMVKLLVGAASGWVGEIAGLMVVCGLVYVAERRRVPYLPIGLAVLCFLFFQAGKSDFRREFWYGGGEAGKIERVVFWVESSYDRWRRDLSDPSGEAWRERVAKTFGRTSLLPQTANVIELTPNVVPFQGARLYSYMLVTFVPRFLWPEKPSANESNRFYQVAYGLTAEENLEGVSIAVGTLTEAYISYGWWGAIVVMLLLGQVLRLFQQVFLRSSSGLLMRSIGISMVFPLMAIEGQMAQYVGGLVQQILIVLLIMGPCVRVLERHLPGVPNRLPWRERLQQVES